VLLIRPARTADVAAIREICEPLVDQRILLGKELVSLYEAVQEFVVAEIDGRVVGCGALHVMWRDLAEVRTLAVNNEVKRRGVGAAMMTALLERAHELGVKRIFCLTFETEFFAGFGFEEISNVPVDVETYAEMVRSSDDGVAEFLDLARVKQNTLGNSRMLKRL
jgi:amino-acid N-acetyltransferase